MLSVLKKQFPKSYAPVLDLIGIGQKEKAISLLPTIDASLVRMARNNPQLWDSLFTVACKDTSEIAPSIRTCRNLLHVYMAAPYGSFRERIVWKQMSAVFTSYLDQTAQETGQEKIDSAAFDLTVPVEASGPVSLSLVRPRYAALGFLASAHPV